MRILSKLCLTFMLILFCLLPLCAQASSASISGQAWLDSANDFYPEEGDRALRGVTVSLFRIEEDEETFVTRVTTGGDGLYSFTGLSAGTYRLSADLPDDHQFTQPREGGSIMLPACGTNSTSLPITLSDGQTVDNAHIGATKSSTYIKAFVFEDLNANGGRSTVEEMLRYVETQLYYEMNGEWIAVSQAKTDKEGCATYWKLTPGTYRLGVTLPAPYIIGPLGEKINGWYNCIPPCDSNSGLSDPFDAPRGSSTGLGVGAVNTGSIHGTIWMDENLDGRYTTGEGAFAGAALTLHSESAGVSRSLVTDDSGEYRFDMLLEGDYTLTVTLPSSAMFALPGDSLFSDGFTFTASTNLQVVTEKDLSVQKIGVMPVTTLGVTFYHDLNANGARDENEPAFAGANAELLVNDVVCASVQSDSEGVAFIPVLRGGDVSVRCVLPDDQVFTVAGDGNDFVSPAASGDIALALTLPHAQHTALNAGVTLPATVSGMLFDDRNLSGILDGDEKGLTDFIVQAIDAGGQIAAQTVTDESGAYAFTSLLPAQHTIRFLLVDAYVFTDHSETGAQNENDVVTRSAVYGDTDVIPLTPGQSVANVDGGIFRSATVAGDVLLDSLVASLPVEGGMEHVLVTLIDEYGAPVSDDTQTVTDADGHFYLKGALPGRYALEYTLPAGTAFTSPFSGNDTFVTEYFDLAAADDIAMPALSAIHTGSLSGVLYHDSNISRAYDAQDPVLASIPVTLYNHDLDVTYETRTLDSGEFIFDSLRPGAYTITCGPLSEGIMGFGVDETSLLAPTTAAIATADFTVEIGQQRVGCNIAANAIASLSGTVYLDMMNDNTRDADDFGAPGVTLTLKSIHGPQSYSVLTDENGAFSLPAMVPGEYTLLVTLESDCIPVDDNPATLQEGFWTSTVTVQDDEEAAFEYAILRYAGLTGQVCSMDGSATGVSGRTVTLWQEDMKIAQVTTSENGLFAFSHLKPGVYFLSCDLPDSTFQFARSQDADFLPSIIRSDADFIEDGVGYSIDLTVTMGEVLDNCVIGIGALGKIGDTAWLDENGNGYQDAGEPAIPGIEIRLYQYGQLIAETTTDAYGRYQIADLFPGKYTAEVTMHKELKTTVRKTDYPLVASILTETDELTAQAEEIIVPSGSRNLNCDLGFVLRKNGKYPDAMKNPPATNWDY